MTRSAATKNPGGRPTLSPTGEKMEGRNIRMLDAEWADACYIGHARVRELVRKDAARKRKKESK